MTTLTPKFEKYIKVHFIEGQLTAGNAVRALDQNKLYVLKNIEFGTIRLASPMILGYSTRYTIELSPEVEMSFEQFKNDQGEPYGIYVTHLAEGCEELHKVLFE